jgi:hypothetical protein
VYAGAVVLAASTVALQLGVLAARAVRRATGVPARTVGRWLAWWRGPFTATAVFVALASRLVPAVATAELPASLLARLAGDPVARPGAVMPTWSPMRPVATRRGSLWASRGGSLLVSAQAHAAQSLSDAAGSSTPRRGLALDGRAVPATCRR